MFSGGNILEDNQETIITKEDLINNPFIQELSLTPKNLENIPLPYVMKNKILMSPGIWNGLTWTNAEIQKGFTNTDFNNKHTRSLFLDHRDKESGEWIGEITNPHLVKNNLVGDLVILDKNTAIKLAYGAKFGISPKIVGEREGNQIRDFSFANFSVVFNPAVKKAFINNSENFNGDKMEDENLARVTDLETERKRRGMSAQDFYAVPRDPPSASSLPIFDAPHIRNAMARFNQTQFKTPQEKKTAYSKILIAAKKFNINVADFGKIMTEESQMAENENSVNETVSTEENNSILLSQKDLSLLSDTDFPSFVIKYNKENGEVGLSELLEAFKKNKATKEFSSDIRSIVREEIQAALNSSKESVKNEGQDDEKEPAEEEETPDEESSEMNNKKESVPSENIKLSAVDSESSSEPVAKKADGDTKVELSDEELDLAFLNKMQARTLASVGQSHRGAL